MELVVDSDGNSNRPDAVFRPISVLNRYLVLRHSPGAAPEALVIHCRDLVAVGPEEPYLDARTPERRWWNTPLGSCFRAVRPGIQSAQIGDLGVLDEEIAAPVILLLRVDGWLLSPELQGVTAGFPYPPRPGLPGGLHARQILEPAFCCRSDGRATTHKKECRASREHLFSSSHRFSIASVQSILVPPAIARRE